MLAQAHERQRRSVHQVLAIRGLGSFVRLDERNHRQLQKSLRRVARTCSCLPLKTCRDASNSLIVVISKTHDTYGPQNALKGSFVPQRSASQVLVALQQAFRLQNLEVFM